MDEREIRRAVTRRDALRWIAASAATLPLAGVAGSLARADAPERAVAAARRARAKSVIEVWLSGGPSHVDTFDPKPEAGRDVCGPLTETAATNVAGVRIGSLLPELAKQADKYSLVRGMSHGLNGHETAAYVVQTGRDPEQRTVYPCLGAVASLFKGADGGYAGKVPPYVVLTTSQGRFSETGFLGPRYAPFVTGGDPNQRRFAVEGIVAEGVSDERQRSRRELLHELDALRRALPESPALDRLARAEDEAYELILGDAGKVFDPTEEKEALRDRYGRTPFGQSCLVARRLVESGVPYVTVHLGGWDTHKQHFEAMRRKLPDLDRGLATLLADLSDRGLLDSTVVWCCGEFGRTPRVSWEPPWNGGRGHFGRAFSALVAGGGFKGGHVVGRTNATGEDVADGAVHPRELHAAIYRKLGIDPDGPLPNSRGLDVRVTDAPPGGGRTSALAEIV